MVVYWYQIPNDLPQELQKILSEDIEQTIKSRIRLVQQLTKKKGASK